MSIDPGAKLPPPLHGNPTRGDRRVPLSPQLQGRIGRMFRCLVSAPALTDVELDARAESMRQTTAPGRTT